MPRLRVHNISMSLDGFAAGAAQDLDNPLGVGGGKLHEWVFATGPDRRVDERFIAAGDDNVGATVMGRNMFGPVRGPWVDEDWTGWWGDDPPYHHDVFVLTHHPRPPVPMTGGTTFHFVTEGVEAALTRAFDAAGGRDVRLGGGVATIQQCLRAGLVDEMHVAVVPVLLGAGERLLAGDAAEGYEVVEFVSSPTVAHYRFTRVDG